jgi:hypothetical protein
MGLIHKIGQTLEGLTPACPSLLRVWVDQGWKVFRQEDLKLGGLGRTARVAWALGKDLLEPHLNVGWVGHKHALEDLGEVPQVEGIVGLGWSGQ